MGLTSINRKEKQIIEKASNNQRIEQDEALFILNNFSISGYGRLAEKIKTQKTGKKVFYNKNIHIEPTNICHYNCAFCSYSSKSEHDSWEWSHEEIIEKIDKGIANDITEVHIVGGVHPERDLFYYSQLLQKIKDKYPSLIIKAFTAIELEYMIRKAGMNYKKGLEILKKSGLDALPGGGAEIFNTQVRKNIGLKKPGREIWLEIHKTAHELNISSNATMLYGHIESFEDRIAHMNEIRKLQDLTHGFNAFIPLKFKNKNNDLHSIAETSFLDDMKTFIMARIFLDNIDHIKAYWPMIGREEAAMLMHFGVNDLDGTIHNSTEIYSRAGAQEKSPEMTEKELKAIITKNGFMPVERNTFYQKV